MKYLSINITLIFVSFSAIAQSETLYLDDDKTIFVVVEDPAAPKGGLKAFNKWNEDNIKRKLRAKKKAKKKKVYVELVINTDGTLSDVKVVKGLDERYDQEALRLIMSNPTPWVSARQRGKKVKSRIVVYIEF